MHLDLYHLYIFKNNPLFTRNILNSNGKFSVGGGTPEFEYISKKSINGIEMYYIRLDVSDGTSVKDEYYGVSVKEGKCYKITGTGMNLVAVEY